ncbi:MAG TPA: transposase [Syntrophus sp. (in: bacteria)]|jgi:REP element-mobilizing transposase RayT|nr:transposase [Syntrophus sp. (in: bacteria)]
MPRGSRIDIAGAVHHIMVRGIERRKIFDSNVDRDHFLHRLSEILQNTGTTCFAWSLMPNHFHLLLRTGNIPISTVMRRLLTGYAIWFNRGRNRHGHLFQNRFKSILCQEDAYLLELVRYIHLNPLRAGLVCGLDGLDKYPYSGHSTLMDRLKNPWQETEEILGLFGSDGDSARRAYRMFVEQGIDHGRRHDLAGGGLIRSAGGWEGLKLKREEGNYQRSDERILGDGDFVSQVLSRSEETLEKRQALRAIGMDLDKTASRVSELMGIKAEDIWAVGKQQHIVNARSLFCFWAVRELGYTMASLGQKLSLSIPAISKSVVRGKQIAESKSLSLIGS